MVEWARWAHIVMAACPTVVAMGQTACGVADPDTCPSPGLIGEHPQDYLVADTDGVDALDRAG